MNVHLEPITVTPMQPVAIPKDRLYVLARVVLQETESPVLVGILHIFPNSNSDGNVCVERQHFLKHIDK